MDVKNKLSNEQAFRSYSAGNVEAANIINDNFEFFIRGKAAYFVTVANDSAIEYNELEIVGKIALQTAISSYKGDVIPFTAYAIRVIENAMKNHLASLTCPTAKLSRQGVSLDDVLYDGNDSLTISDSIGEVYDLDEIGYYSPRAIGYHLDNVLPVLTDLEKALLNLKLAGYSYLEIRQKLDLSKRVMDRTIAEMKKKYRDTF